MLTETPFHYRTLPVQYTLSGGFPPEILDFSIGTSCQSLQYICSTVCASRLERLPCTRRHEDFFVSKSSTLRIPPCMRTVARRTRSKTPASCHQDPPEESLPPIPKRPQLPPTMPEGDPAQASASIQSPALKWNGAIISTTPPSLQDLKNPYLRSRTVDIETSRILAYDIDGVPRTRAEATAQADGLITQIGDNKEALALFWADICSFLAEAPGMGSPIEKAKISAPFEGAGPAPRALAQELLSPSPTLKRKADSEEDISSVETVKQFRVETAGRRSSRSKPSSSPCRTFSSVSTLL